MTLKPSLPLLLAALPVLYSLTRAIRGPRRPRKISKSLERIIVLGASSGVGRVLAQQYAQRGARVCVVGRRASNVADVVEECKSKAVSGLDKIIGFPGDFTSVEDMVRLRDIIRREWDGVDTLVVCAGVSALQPFMNLTGVRSTTEDAGVFGIQEAVRISNLALSGNFTGPLVAAATFISMLQATSPSPSILLISSLAAVIPAPTRSLYASTKSSSLVLYQCLAIEHPRIAFSHLLPYTIEGNFRASAVDKGPVRESDPNKSGLKALNVAKRCVRAVDWEERGTIIMPSWPYVIARFIYNHVSEGLVSRFAVKKYGFTPES